MKFKGHQKTSFIDYPDKIATVVFTGGCHFRCHYCHNPELVHNQGLDITEEVIFQYLIKRKYAIDAVCISGGEATLHHELPDFIRRVKTMGYLVKIDTNGMNPEMLKALMTEGLLDYIAMDIKAPLHKYGDVVAVKVDTAKIQESLNLIRASDIDYEFRTTIAKEILHKEAIIEIAELIKGAKRYRLQNFKEGSKILGGKGRFTGYSSEELNKMKKILEGWFEDFKIRK